MSANRNRYAADGVNGLLQEAPRERMVRFLTEHEIPFELIDHPPAETALAEARLAGSHGDRTAKGVLVYTEAGYAVAVIPASRKLDLDKTSAALDANAVRASEAELAVLFPDHPLGIVPLFGPGAPKTVLIDERLLDGEAILCSAGDHQHSLRLAPRDLVNVVPARRADLIET